LFYFFLLPGSGKTYTIEGELGEAKGIIPRAAELIFQCILVCMFAGIGLNILHKHRFVKLYNFPCKLWPMQTTTD